MINIVDTFNILLPDRIPPSQRIGFPYLPDYLAHQQLYDRADGTPSCTPADILMHVLEHVDTHAL